MPKYLRLDLLLIFVPIAAYLEFATQLHTYVFVASCLAIIPMAGWMGKATEHLAERTSEGIGGLLNATFGNAAELIIALVALRAGMFDVVKASITGSIIGNLLLVLGAACLAGGLRHQTLTFNAKGVSSYSSMLFLAAAALILPATFHLLAGGNSTAEIARERTFSLEISIVLILTYTCSLLFSLHTHKQLFIGNAAQTAAAEEDCDPKDHKPWSTGKAIGVLAAATVMIAILAEWMVGSVSHAAKDFGMSNVFIGIIIVAIVGNAAEHSTAIMVSLKNRMDLAMGVAIGSSIQIALFVAPVLVFASYAIAPRPLDLVFTPAEVIAVVLAVIVTEQVVSDGETHWLEGVQLLSVYVILALMFYLLPESAVTHLDVPAHAPAVE